MACVHTGLYVCVLLQFVDSRTYNMVISVCAEAGDLKHALHAADMLRMAGLNMETILYTNLIKGAPPPPHSAPQSRRIAEHLQKGRQAATSAALPGTNPTWFAPLPYFPAACAAAGNAERAFQLYAELREAGLPMEKQVYCALISACSAQIGKTHADDRWAGVGVGMAGIGSVGVPAPA
jgi:pentatricopeptide repeat protein